MQQRHGLTPREICLFCAFKEWYLYLSSCALDLNQHLIGANVLTTSGSHNLDALNYVLGDFKTFSANTHKHREFRVTDAQGNPKAIDDSDVPDSVSIIGTLETGVSVNIHTLLVGKGSNHPEGTTWYIYGEKGTLKLEVPTLMFGMGPARLFQFKDGRGWVEIDVEKTNATAGVYEAFAKGDWKNLVTFEQAVVRQRMLEAIYKSAKDGTRESYKKTP